MLWRPYTLVLLLENWNPTLTSKVDRSDSIQSSAFKHVEFIRSELSDMKSYLKTMILYLIVVIPCNICKFLTLLFVKSQTKNIYTTPKEYFKVLLIWIIVLQRFSNYCFEKKRRFQRAEAEKFLLKKVLQIRFDCIIRGTTIFVIMLNNSVMFVQI